MADAGGLGRCVTAKWPRCTGVHATATTCSLSSCCLTRPTSTCRTRPDGLPSTVHSTSIDSEWVCLVVVDAYWVCVISTGGCWRWRVEAASHNQIPMTELLVAAGADATLRTNDGRTADELTTNHSIVRRLERMPTRWAGMVVCVGACLDVDVTVYMCVSVHYSHTQVSACGLMCRVTTRGSAAAACHPSRRRTHRSVPLPATQTRVYAVWPLT